MRVLVLVVAAVLLLAPAGWATDAPIGGVVVAEAYTFVPGGDNVAGGAAPGTVGPVVIARGTDVLFVNLEATLALDSHTMTADGCAYEHPDPCWFDSGDPRAQAPGETAVVRTSHLLPGSYGFFCAVHDVMRGTLVVA